MMTARVMILSTALSGGGAEEVTRCLAEHLPGCICVVFENRREIRSTQFKLHVLCYRQSPGTASKILLNLLRLVEIQWLKFRYRPDVTISHLEGPNFANLLTVRGGKRVIVIHNSLKHNYIRNRTKLSRLKLFLAAALYRRADHAVVVSRDISNELIEICGMDSEHVRYIPNPIDFNSIRVQAAQRFGDWRDDLLGQRFLINVASLTEQKNHELLIRAFATVVVSYPDLKLLILGEGSKRESILKLCTDLDLIDIDARGRIDSGRSRVLLLGFQSNPYPFLANARFFVLPSLWEGLPISMLEAMTLNKSLIVSNCSSAIREIINVDGTTQRLEDTGSFGEIRTPFGYLMNNFKDPQDRETISSWERAIRSLMDDEMFSKECGDNSYALSRNFDVQHSIAHWVELVRRLTGKTPV
jgi:glycosyltransferase involved in cell wall biosynthesis